MLKGHRRKTIILVLLQYAITGFLISVSMSALLVAADAVVSISTSFDFTPFIIVAVLISIVIGYTVSKTTSSTQERVEQERRSLAFILASIALFIVFSIMVTSFAPPGIFYGSLSYGVGMIATLLLSYFVSHRYLA